MKHELTLRVYYEETDMAGIVYYANYLKFIERGRTDFVRALGVDQTTMKEGQGLVFAVKSLTADYISPAKFDDILRVETTVTGLSAARMVMSQQVFRDDTLLFDSSVTVISMTLAGKPVRLPAYIRRNLDEMQGRVVKST